MRLISRILPFSQKHEKRIRLSRTRLGTFGIFLFMAAVSVFMAIPVIYSVIQAFKPLDEIFAFPPRFFVRNPTFDNFKQVLYLADNLWVPFSRYLFNSISVSFGGTFLFVIISALAAYPLAKARVPGIRIISTLIIVALMFNGDVVFLPRYVIISKLGMLDTYYAMILPTLAGTIGVFLIRQFIVAAVPDSTLEAARIDGAGEYGIFFRIILPTIKPALMTTVIFGFQVFWNNNAQNFIYNENLKQLQSVLPTIAAGGIGRAGAGAAVSVVLMIPPVIIFLISQNNVNETMAYSGLK